MYVRLRGREGGGCVSGGNDELLREFGTDMSVRFWVLAGINTDLDERLGIMTVSSGGPESRHERRGSGELICEDFWVRYPGEEGAGEGGEKEDGIRTLW